MRFCQTILLCACFVFSAAGVSAQQAGLHLPSRESTVAELFRQIERQTGCVLIFDAGTIPLERRLLLPEREGTVAGFLDLAVPRTGYAWMQIDNYIVIRTLAPADPASAAVPPQPTREDFERDVREYTRRNLSGAKPAEEITWRYDTIRVEKPHDGVFSYPSREFPPIAPARTVKSLFPRDTPPLLAVKTNLVWWAARGTLNLGGEVGLGKRTSLELSGGINRLNLKGSIGNNDKLAHWVVKPEFRYWLCERFSGHFFGLHAIYGRYNVGGWNIPLLFEKEFRYEGYIYGGGVAYGYHLPLSRRWGLEFSAGVGVLGMLYSKYDCEKCGSEIDRFDKTYFGPTSVGVKVVFLIK
jgi:hypothetical protein